jgi:septum formation protein
MTAPLSSRPGPALILASASRSRARMLQAAGVAFETEPPHVDEGAIKDEMKRRGATVMQCAEALAEMKARAISDKRRGALVIGADQMLDCEGAWFDKPVDMAGARGHLTKLSGRIHTLPTAAVVLCDGIKLWSSTAAPKLTMRPLSDDFITSYLAHVGDNALSSVGAYQLESVGGQLFTDVSGDFFTILGMPLLPLLGFLREQGIIPS